MGFVLLLHHIQYFLFWRISFAPRRRPHPSHLESKKFSKTASTDRIFAKSKAVEIVISCLSWNWCGASWATGIRPRACLVWVKWGKAGREQSLQKKFLFFFLTHVSLMAQFRNQGPFSSDKVTSEMRGLIRQTNTFSLSGNLKGRSKI